MSNFSKSQRVVSNYRARINSLPGKYLGELEKESDIKNSERYKKIENEINQKIQAEAKKYREMAINQLESIYKDCEKNIENHYKKTPTQEMINKIQMVKMRRHISPTELQLLIEQYADCYDAAQVLFEIAEDHGYTVKNLPGIDDMKHALDAVKANQLFFLNAYQGEDSVKTSPTMITLERYFRSENNYGFADVKSSQEADQMFWRDIVGFGSPEMFDTEGRPGKDAKVRYRFNMPSELNKFIKEQTEGLTDEEKEDKANEILSQCPNQWSAAYRHYKATGEEVPLLEDGERINTYGEIIPG